MEIITPVITSIIAGVFTLVGIWLNHKLTVRRQILNENTMNTDGQPIQTGATATEPESNNEAAIESERANDTADKERYVPMLLWLSILPYTGFTLILLMASGDDQKAGFLFIVNSLVIMIGSVITYFGKVKASTVCIVATFMQLLVLMAMLVLELGDVGIVVPINIGIGVAFGLMALFYRKTRESMT